MTNHASMYYQKWLLGLPDSDQRIFTRDLSILKNMVPKKTHVHLIGICGKGTATVAGLLKEQGFKVSGSDDHFYPPMSTIVEALDVTVFKSYNASNIEGADVVIVGNVCPPDHIEVLAAKEKNILQISMSEALEYFFLQDKKNVIVAGTHGKTTLSGMISWVLEHADLDPLYFIGGVIQGRNNSHRFSKGSYSVLEGDEYDTAYFDKGPKFLHYKPWCGIITSCEYDHVLMYPSFEEYKQAFKFFIEEIDPAGFLIIHEAARQILKDYCDAFSGKIITYGTTSASTYSLSTVDLGSLKVHGTYNLENALAAYIVGTICCGLNGETVKEHLATFPGMAGRQEALFESKKYVFLNDFAHHPTAVRVTLEGIRSHYPNRRIICLFEPRSSSSRKKLFEKPYSESFDAADIIFICAPELRSNDDPNDFVDVNHVISLLNSSGKQAYSSHKTEEVLAKLSEILAPGDVIVTMSNASFDNIQEKIIVLLTKNQ